MQALSGNCVAVTCALSRLQRRVRVSKSCFEHGGWAIEWTSGPECTSCRDPPRASECIAKFFGHCETGPPGVILVWRKRRIARYAGAKTPAIAVA